MRRRMAWLAIAVGGLLVAMRCIGPPDARGPRPPDPMVGVKPWVPPLQSTPSPFLRTPDASSTATPPPGATPAPAPSPEADGTVRAGAAVPESPSR